MNMKNRKTRSQNRTAFLLVALFAFFVVSAIAANALLTPLALESFEQTRTGNSSLPRNVFYRPDTLPVNADEKSWPWLPLSTDSFDKILSLKYDFDANQGENLVSRNFSVNGNPIQVEFFVKPNITFIGNNPAESVQFLFYRIDRSVPETPVCIDEIRYSDGAGLAIVERETPITLTAKAAGGGWKNLTLTVGGCAGVNNGYFYLTSTPDQYSGWVLFDNFTISQIT